MSLTCGPDELMLNLIDLGLVSKFYSLYCKIMYVYLFKRDSYLS